MDDDCDFSGKRVLIVEDDYIIATDVADWFTDRGAEVVGPAGSVRLALELLGGERPVDCALLDINLTSERVYPVADTLSARGIPFVFATGYDAQFIPAPYRDIPRCEKPVNKAALARLLAAKLASAESGK